MLPDGRGAVGIDLRDAGLDQVGRLERLGDPGRAVDDHLAQEGEHLAGAVLLFAEMEQFRVLVDEGGVALPLEEDRMGDDVLQEADVGLDAAHAELLQRAVHDVGRLVEGQSPGADLDQQRIVVRGDLGAGEGVAGIQAHAAAGCRAVGGQGAEIRGEVVGRVLGGDAALDGVAAHVDGRLGGDVDLRVGQLVAAGHQDLVLHQVAAGDHLGHRVLHLDAGVHLDEVVLPLLIHQELDGPGVAVLDLPGDLEGRRAEFFPLGLGQGERRGELDHLLVAALHRAVAVEEMHQIAVVVAQHLHLDMLGVGQVALQEDLGIAEGGLGLAGGRHQPLQQLLLVVGHAHAAPAAAGRGLDDDRIAVLLGELEGLLLFLDGVLGAGHHVDTGRDGGLAAGDLVPQGPHHLGGGADKGNAVDPALFGKLGVFRQETVTGVNGVHIGLDRQGDDFVDSQVGVDGRLALADQIGLVGLVAMQGELVLLGIDGHRADTQLGTGAKDPDGDLSAIGGHNLTELLFLHVNPPLRCFLFGERPCNSYLNLFSNTKIIQLF